MKLKAGPADKWGSSEAREEGPLQCVGPLWQAGGWREVGWQKDDIGRWAESDLRALCMLCWRIQPLFPKPGAAVQGFRGRCKDARLGDSEEREFMQLIQS